MRKTLPRALHASAASAGGQESGCPSEQARASGAHLCGAHPRGNEAAGTTFRVVGPRERGKLNVGKSEDARRGGLQYA